jgi:hypothetical protein
MTHSSAAVAVCFSALAAAVVFQQAPRAITLRPADATLGEEFTSLYSVRELADGRVLISDYSRDNRVVVADLALGRVRRVGNVGAGPREYRQAGRLFALPGDSTLLIDSPDHGVWWLLMHHDSIVSNVLPDLPALRIAGKNLWGADSRGRVLGVRQAGAELLTPTHNKERLVAVIANRNDSRGDTIASLRGAEFQITQTGTRQRPFWVFRQISGTVPEQALMFTDGWVGIVFVEPYRVEWLTASGALVRGPTIPWEWPRADAKEKAAAFERLKRRVGEKAKADDTPWADRIAPIRPNALLGTPEGNLLVLRAQWLQAMDTNYDLFDRTGRRIATLALPDSERIVGFGVRSAYVSVRDGDGFHHLRRHPWP